MGLHLRAELALDDYIGLAETLLDIAARTTIKTGRGRAAYVSDLGRPRRGTAPPPACWLAPSKTKGASGRRASSISTTNGRTSYFTLIKRMASSATLCVVAATAARLAPT